jgi:Na+/H+ antiporter NhaA
VDMKKLIGATVAVFVILFVAGFLVHGVWLGTTYREMLDSGFSFRPEEAMRHRFWLIWVSDALCSMLFVCVYQRERGETLGGSRNRYGVLMTLFTVMPSTMNDYVV